jgi:hypothetical protein
LKSKYGHTPLAWDEIKEVVEEDKPDYLVIGTGFWGAMPILGLTEQAETMGIKVLVEETKSAIDEFTKLINEGRKVIGVFHLTC